MSDSVFNISALGDNLKPSCLHRLTITSDLNRLESVFSGSLVLEPNESLHFYSPFWMSQGAERTVWNQRATNKQKQTTRKNPTRLNRGPPGAEELSLRLNPRLSLRLRPRLS